MAQMKQEQPWQVERRSQKQRGSQASEPCQGPWIILSVMGGPGGLRTETQPNRSECGENKSGTRKTI